MAISKMKYAEGVHFMKKNIAALSNHKFNTAKTTTAFNLGYALINQGKLVLLDFYSFHANNIAPYD